MLLPLLMPLLLLLLLLLLPIWVLHLYLQVFTEEEVDDVPVVTTAQKMEV